MVRLLLSISREGPMHVYLIASSVNNIIVKRVAVVSARMVSIMLRLICVFLGCDMLI